MSTMREKTNQSRYFHPSPSLLAHSSIAHDKNSRFPVLQAITGKFRFERQPCDAAHFQMANPERKNTSSAGVRSARLSSTPDIDASFHLLHTKGHAKTVDFLTYGKTYCVKISGITSSTDISQKIEHLSGIPLMILTMNSLYLNVVLATLKDDFFVPLKGVETLKHTTSGKPLIEVDIFIVGINSSIFHWTEKHGRNGCALRNYAPYQSFEPNELPTPKEFGQVVSNIIRYNRFVVDAMARKRRGDEIAELSYAMRKFGMWGLEILSFCKKITVVKMCLWQGFPHRKHREQNIGELKNTLYFAKYKTSRLEFHVVGRDSSTFRVLVFPVLLFLSALLSCLKHTLCFCRTSFWNTHVFVLGSSF
ncbi:hypothetical protein GMAR_ORF283 [Golden Marseillevirus]|uniref:hypothetical protein n=1 Tax=Golden Marseillevirus TaxID=1720526 RepID=UPI000877AC08|nr:hypothetical protein GMAR_ORF283 [Golden Marseillevirus]ALX27657.1 hypothetical protein GMAR_ORF283 [Golden Marseillevirus]